MSLPIILVTFLYKLGEQRRCGDSPNSLGAAQTLGAPTAFALICKGPGSEGVGGGAEPR